MRSRVPWSKVRSLSRSSCPLTHAGKRNRCRAARGPCRFSPCPCGNGSPRESAPHENPDVSALPEQSRPRLCAVYRVLSPAIPPDPKPADLPATRKTTALQVPQGAADPRQTGETVQVKPRYHETRGPIYPAARCEAHACCRPVHAPGTWHLYRCDGPSCPGLRWQNSIANPHPPTCSEEFIPWPTHPGHP